jgi:hypothetical protein
MPADVGQGFLDDAVDDGFDDVGERGVECGPYGGGSALPQFESMREEFERRHQAQIIEHAWPKLVSDVPQVLLDGGKMLPDYGESTARARRKIARGLGERDVSRGQQLAGLVVEGLPDCARLPLQSGVQTPEEFVSVVLAMRVHDGSGLL